MKKTTKPTKRNSSAKSKNLNWQFIVRSYRVVAEFSPASLPTYQPSLTVVVLAADPVGPTAGRPNAVAYFYWPGRKLPATPSGVHNNTLELHYPLAALGGILQMLENSTDVVCYYTEDASDPLSPRAGLQQQNFHVCK